MCTVTILPLPSRRRSARSRPAREAGYRLVCNRDESVRRPEALPPRRAVAGERRALMPIDPQGGGTWIGVNDAGLTLTLLNRSSGAAPPGDRPLLSRGLIIPRLLSERTAREASAALGRLPLARHAPFRLVLVDPREVREARWDGRRLLGRAVPLREPIVYASSGLGDHTVTRPRAALFRRLLAQGGDPARVQDRFHRQGHPDRPHLGVVMSRHGARTVSRTTVRVAAGSARMAYEPLPGRAADQAGYNPRRWHKRLSMRLVTSPRS